MKRQPGTLKLSKEIRASLVRLAALTPMRDPPHLDLEAVEALEAELGCGFSDDVLALFAFGGDELGERCGIELDQVRTMTDDAHEQGCPDDLVTIGCDADGHVHFCVKRKPDGRIFLFDNQDGSAAPVSLAFWLKERVSISAETGASEAAPFVAPALIGPIASAVRKVRHKKFGEGTVVREIGQGAEKKLEIQFADGKRVLIASAVSDA